VFVSSRFNNTFFSYSGYIASNDGAISE